MPNTGGGDRKRTTFSSDSTAWQPDESIPDRRIGYSKVCLKLASTPGGAMSANGHYSPLIHELLWLRLRLLLFLRYHVLAVHTIRHLEASRHLPQLISLMSPKMSMANPYRRHFAYSTTLRRHHTEVEEEVQSLWQKFVRHVTGQGEYETLDSGHANVPSATDERKDTLSAKYALYTVEVCFAERLINSTDAVKLPSGNASPLSNEPSNGTTVIEYLFAPTSSRL
jgi:hypothetical protein